MKALTGRYGLIFLIFASLLMAGCTGSSSDETQEEFGMADLSETLPPLTFQSPQFTVYYDSDLAPQLGWGYNSINQASTGVKCIVERGAGDNLVTDYTLGGSIKTEYSYEYIESTQDLAEKMAINTAATLDIAGFSGSLNFGFLKDVKISSHTVAALVSYEITGRSLTFDDAVLQPTLEGNANIFGICGDYHVRTISGGGNLYALITIESSSMAQKTAIKSELDVAYKETASSETEFSSSFSQALSKYSASVKVYSVGCTPVGPVSDFASFQEVLSTFKEDTEACLTNDVMLMATKATFLKSDSLYLAGGISDITSIRGQKDAMDDLIEFSMEYNLLLDDIAHFESNLYQYDVAALYDTEAAALTATGQKKTLIEGYLATFEDRINDCIDYPFMCEFLDEADVPAAGYPSELRIITMPPLADFYPQNCNEIMLAGYESLKDGTYDVYFGGDSDKAYSAYCVGLDDTEGTPKTYVTLADSNVNYAHFRNYWQWKSGGSDYWPHMRTNYSKVRIETEGDSVHIDIFDDTFSVTTVTPYEVISFPVGTWIHADVNDLWSVPYGAVIGSYSGWEDLSHLGAYPGYSKIDLQGTGLTVANDQNWNFTGTNIKSALTFSNNRQTVFIQVGGSNGYGKPIDSTIKLQYYD